METPVVSGSLSGSHLVPWRNDSPGSPFHILAERLVSEHERVLLDLSQENARLRSLLVARGESDEFTLAHLGSTTAANGGGAVGGSLSRLDSHRCSDPDLVLAMYGARVGRQDTAGLRKSRSLGTPVLERVFKAWCKVTQKLRAQRGFSVRDVWKRSSDIAAGDDDVSRQMNGFHPRRRSLIDDMDRRQKMKVMRFMLQPSGTPRVCWDVFGALLLCWDMIMIPLQAFEIPSSDFLLFMDWFTLFFWTGDMFMSCITGYVHKGSTVMDLRLALLNYIKTWLILDLITLAPEWAVLAFDDSGNKQGSTSRVFRGLRAFRVARLLRLAKFRRIVTMLRDRIDSEVTFITMNVSKLILMLLLVNHFLACLWYFIGTLSQGSQTENWIDSDQLFADKNFGYRYTTSLHWSLTQFTPASMSVQPQNVYERTFAIAVLVFGLVLFSSFISAITASMSQLGKMQDDKSKQFWLLRRFLRQHNVENQLSFRVLRYVEYACRETEEFVAESRVQVLNLLSEQLWNELQYVVSFGCMQIHPLFVRAGQISNMGMNQLSRTALKQQSLAVGDMLFTRGSKSSRMSILVSGEMRYGKEEANDPPIHLSHSDWLCEHALWVDWSYVGSALSTLECKIVTIDAKAFAEVIGKDMPSFMFISLYARNFAQWLCSQPYTELTDAFQAAYMVAEMSKLIDDYENVTVRDVEDLRTSLSDETEVPRFSSDIIRTVSRCSSVEENEGCRGEEEEEETEDKVMVL